MTRTEVNAFQPRLNAKQAEVVRTTGRREGLAIERTTDALDQVQFAAEREFASRGLVRESMVLRDVHTASGAHCRWYLWHMPGV